MEFDYAQFMNTFYQYVPEMKNMVEQKFKEGDIRMSDGGLVIWGVGVMNCVLALMQEESKHSKTLDSVFLFMEKMAQESEETKSLLKYTFHAFMNEDHLLPAALSRMGLETRKFWDEYMEGLRQFRLWKLSQM